MPQRRDRSRGSRSFKDTQFDQERGYIFSKCSDNDSDSRPGRPLNRVANLFRSGSQLRSSESVQRVNVTNDQFVKRGSTSERTNRGRDNYRRSVTIQNYYDNRSYNVRAGEKGLNGREVTQNSARYGFRCGCDSCRSAANSENRRQQKSIRDDSIDAQFYDLQQDLKRLQARASRPDPDNGRALADIRADKKIYAANLARLRALRVALKLNSMA